MSLVDTKGLNDAAQQGVAAVKQVLSGFDPATSKAIMDQVKVDLGLVAATVTDIDVAARHVDQLAGHVDLLVSQVTKLVEQVAVDGITITFNKEK